MRSEIRWRRLRRIGVMLAGLIAVLLVAYLGGLVLLRAALDPSSLADRAEPRLSAALHRRVSVQTAELSLFPRPEVRLFGVQVENLPDFEGLPLATVAELRLRPRMLALLRRRVEVHRVRVEGPRLLLQVAEDGKTNFGDFVPASRTGSGEESVPVAFAVRGIDVRAGRVGYRDAVSGRSLQADGVRLSGSVARSAEGLLDLDIVAEAENLRFALPPAWRRGARSLRVRSSIRGVAGPGFNWLQIVDGAIAVNGLGLKLTGRVDSLASARRIVELRLSGTDIDLSEAAEALPDSIRDRLPLEARGRLGVDVAVRGPLGQHERPVVEGLVTVRDASLGRRDAIPLLEAARADIRLSENRAETADVRARLPGGELRATVVLSLDSTLSYLIDTEASADAASLIEATRVGTPQSARPRAGTLRLAARVAGDLVRPDATSLAGRLVVRDLQVAGGRLAAPVWVDSADVGLDGDAASWRDVGVRAGDDEIRTSGTLRDLFGRFAEGGPRVPVIDATARAERLDLDSVLGPGDERAGYGRLAWGRLGGRQIEGRSPEEWATDRRLHRPGTYALRGRLDFRADSMIRRPYRLSNVEGKLRFEPDRIDIEGVRFRVYGGSGTAGGGIRLGDSPSEPFLLNLTLEDARAEDYLSQNSPLGGLISGSLSFDVNFEGELDSLALPLTRVLQGAGRFEILDGRIAPNPLTEALLGFLHLDGVGEIDFTRWIAPFAIRDGAIVLENSRLAGPALEADLEGAVGFGGSLDLDGLVRPDSALALRAAAGVGAAGGALDRYVASGGILELALRLTGRATDPRIVLDPTAMEESSRSALREGAEAAARSGETRIRERGLELLRGLAQPPAEQALPPDSGAGTDSDDAGGHGG